MVKLLAYSSNHTCNTVLETWRLNEGYPENTPLLVECDCGKRYQRKAAWKYNTLEGYYWELVE